MLDLDDHVALVTGGARGVGAACVKALAKAGARVWVFDTNHGPNAYNHYETKDIGGFDAACNLKNELSGVGPAISVRDVNLCDETAFLHGLDEICSLDEPPRFLVNAIGISKTALALDTTTEHFMATLESNLVAPAVVCREVSRKLIQADLGGAIVNIGSIAGKTPFTDISAYSAAKAALSAYSTSLAVELAPQYIQVNTVCPGMIMTNMWSYLRISLDHEGLNDDEFWEQMLSMIPQRKFQTADATADLVLAVLRNNEITGQSISIDGGMNRHA